MAVLTGGRERDTAEARGAEIRRQQEIREAGGRTLIYVVLMIGSIIFVAPFAWMVTASLQDVSEMFQWPPSWIPTSPSFDNYVTFFQQERIGRFFFNSAFVAVTVTALQLFTSSLAAYTFAKRKFPGRDLLFVITLGTLMIPGQVTLIPNYVILRHIPFFGGNDWLGSGGSGWLDSYWGLIVPQAASAFGIFLMRQYMTSIPNDLLDAARIDGGSEFRIFAEIVMPLCRPALAALGIFTFTYQWDDFFWPLIIITSEELRTLPLGLALFVVKNRTAWDLLMAGSVITTVPVLIIFLMFQRHFIRGIAVSGMK
ncbi:MAG TPA: carbohydrate ABC transporter permease [Thermomicrobiales bacterium]|nr:carbohydrate ABC transporter permease [Thermomicrobiales bacterium]